MPGVGGGGGGGGFHGGGFSGGGSHSGGGYHGGGYYGGGYYGGGYYRRGGIFSSLLGAILSPLIFGIVGIVLIAMFFLTVNSKSVEYDEDAFQSFALERYADLYGNSEEGILFVFLGSEEPESDGYYQISIVGYDLSQQVNALFGGDTTYFGRAVDNGLPSNYKNSMTTALRSAVDDTANYIENDIGKESVFSHAPTTALTPQIKTKNVDFLNVSTEYVQASLDDFKEKTGATLSIYVGNVDDVFKRGSMGWILLVAGLICLGISVLLVFLAVKAIKAIKSRRSGGSSGGYSGGSSGSGSSDSGYSGGSSGGYSGDDPYGGRFTDRYSE